MSLPKTEEVKCTSIPGAVDGDITRDRFLDGRIVALQPRSGPRAAIDALLLAAAIPTKPGAVQHVLEAGTGSGVASLALCERLADVRVTGVEIQPALVRLAQENAVLNGIDNRLEFIEQDVTLPWSQLEKAGLAREGFDHVAANPPFYSSGTVRERADPATAKAYSFKPDELQKWMRFLTTAVAARGTVTIIHKPEALPELLALMEGRFGAINVFPLFPAHGAAASRVLVQGTKGSRAPFELLAGMVLHQADGSYTTEADAVLRGAEALKLRTS